MFEFDAVSKRYRDGTLAVKRLDLVVPSDRVTVLVGPSGCGKTTTLRMFNRMLEPTSGTITWDGTPLHARRKTALRRQMGYVIQSGGLFPHRTVLDNVTTVPRLVGWTAAQARRRALELLEQVGLDRRLAKRFPAQLSGGQQQRVGVARALAADPPVLLMDEPFSAVDPVVRADLHTLLLDLQAELHKTIVLITHDIDEAVKLGDQVVILRIGGEVAQAGSPLELLNAPADAFVAGFVGRDRGYRSLSFTPAAGLTPGRARAVRDPRSAGDEPTVVLDAEGHPMGWADRETGRTLPLGTVFDPGTDTLRVALDSALSSPRGLAIAVDHETGRYRGVVDVDTILAQVTTARVEFARALVAEPEPDATAGPDPAPAADPEVGPDSEASPAIASQADPQTPTSSPASPPDPEAAPAAVSPQSVPTPTSSPASPSDPKAAPGAANIAGSDEIGDASEAGVAEEVHAPSARPAPSAPRPGSEAVSAAVASVDAGDAAESDDIGGSDIGGSDIGGSAREATGAASPSNPEPTVVDGSGERSVVRTAPSAPAEEFAEEFDWGDDDAPARSDP